MIDEVYVGFFDFWNAIWMGDYGDDIIKCEEAVAFDFCVDVLACGLERKLL